MFWFVLLLAALMCVHLYQRLRTRRERMILAHLPNWPSLPFIGSAYKFLWDRNFYNHYIEISNIMEETGQPFVLWFGNHCFIVLSDPEEIRIVSNTNLEKSYFYDFIRCVLGNGLITAPGATWRHSIKKLGNVFRQSNIEAFQDIFNKQSQILVENLQTEVNGGPFELQHKYLTNVTLKAVAESTLGVSPKGDIIDENFTNAFIRTFDVFTRRATNICLHFEAIFRVTPAYKEIQESSSIVRNTTLSILKEKIADMAEKHEKIPVDTGNINFEKMSTKSFLEILLEMSENDSDLTDEQIKDEVTTILLAGQETAASTLNFVLLVLGIRQDVQNKLYDEILQVIGDRRRPILKEDLKSLTYCEAVIYETLRLYPPVPAILRRIDHEVQIKSCTIPKGSTCAFNIWGSGRSKRVWGPDAMVYKPERWLDPITASKNALSLLNFSVGKRVCIGRRYAVNIVKTMLVYCLTEFEFSSEADKMVLQMDILLRPISGNLLEIKRRKTE